MRTENLTPSKLAAIAEIQPEPADIAKLDDIITYMEGTPESTWGVDVVRSTGENGEQLDCFFGHLFTMGRDEIESNKLWDWFESAWSTTYGIYPVNDGENPAYQQATPKQRVLAYLRALRAGEETTTMQSMELDSLRVRS